VRGHWLAAGPPGSDPESPSEACGSSARASKRLSRADAGLACACLRCCSLDSMRGLALDHDAVIRRGVPVPTRVRARRKLEQDP
jgi:hypothetical protein